MMLIILVACLCFSLVFEYNRYSKYIPMIIFFIIICFTKDNSDLYYYLARYEKAGQGYFGTIGNGSYFLSLIMYCFSRIGLDYYSFRMAITLIEILMINSTLNRYLRYQSLFWTMLIIFPGWWMSTILRHTLALSILLYGIRYLIEDKKYNTIKFALCVIISGLIHSAFWLFLILVIVKYFETKRVVIFSIIISLFMVLARSTKVVERLIMIFPLEDDIASRLDRASLSFKSVFVNFVLALSIASIGLLSYLMMEEKIKFKSNRKIVKVDTSNNSIYRYLISINCCSITVIGFSLYSSVCNRLFHFFAIYNLIAFSLCEQKYRGSKKNAFFLKAFIIIYLIFVSDLFCYFTPTLKTNIIDVIFYNNSVIGW